MKKFKLLSILTLILVGATTVVAQKNKRIVQVSPPPPLALLDLNNPDDAVKADRKVASSLVDGEECVYYWEGNVYTR